MTTQDKPAVGPLSAGDLVQHVVAKNMFRVIRRIDGEWPDVWLNMVGEPRQAHMADRWVFVGRPGPDGWISWSGGENPVPGQMVLTRTRRVTAPEPVKSEWIDWNIIIAFRLAPTAPVEAGGSERDEVEDIEWPESPLGNDLYRHVQSQFSLHDDEAAEEAGEILSILAKHGVDPSKLPNALRPQPSGETREAVARELAEERMSADEAAHNECGTTPYDQTIDDFMPDALAFVDRILALIRPAAPGGGWRPIETAPKDGALIQAWRTPPSCTGPTWEPLVYVRWDDEDETWVWPDETYEVFSVRGRELADFKIADCEFFASNEFTHWMPLPQAPATPAGEGGRG